MILFKQDVHQEGVWVRCKSFNKDTGMLYGKLLNEPDNNFGVHLGDLIGFRVITDNDGNDACLHLQEYK